MPNGYGAPGTDGISPLDGPRFPAHAHMSAGTGEGLIGLSLRQPPANQQAEQAVLGALLRNNKAYDRVSDFLRPEHFYDPLHGRIYGAIQRRIEAGQVADFLTLRPEFENSGELDAVGGVTYLADLLQAMVGIINAGEYGQMIRDAWVRRQVIDLCETGANLAFGMTSAAELDTGGILEHLDTGLLALTDRQGRAEVQDSATVAGEAEIAMLEAMTGKHGLRGLTTGYRGLDRMLGGMLPGQLIVLAGRPGMGKSALAGGIAWRAAQAQARVLFVSLEMDAVSIFHRGVAAVAHQPIMAATRGAVEEGDTLRPIAPESPIAGQLVRAVRGLGRLPLQWLYQGGATLAQIRAAARRMKRRGGLDLVVIDYLQLMRPSATAQRYGNKVQEVSELSAGAKALATELSVPVLLLSQLSREVEKRDDKRPQLSDLRDSGTIEQDADVVMFAYREHYYLKDRPPVRGKETEEAHEAALAAWQSRLGDLEFRGEIIVRKQRQGRVGPVRMRWEPGSAWFRDESEDSNGPAVPGLILGE